MAAAQARKIPLVGLSALMTTTAPAMAETIRQLRAAGLACKVVVGAPSSPGTMPPASGPTAMPRRRATVHYAQEVLGG